MLSSFCRKLIGICWNILIVYPHNKLGRNINGTNKGVFILARKKIGGGGGLQSMTIMKCFHAIFKTGLLFQRTQNKTLICYSAVANGKPWKRKRKKEREKSANLVSMKELLWSQWIEALDKRFLIGFSSWSSYNSYWISLALSISKSFFLLLLSIQLTKWNWARQYKSKAFYHTSSWKQLHFRASSLFAYLCMCRDGWREKRKSLI